MPIYEYGCRSCGHTLDALQKINDKVLRKCPECGKPALKRLMSAPAFRLKGGGWYETDFKADGEKKRNLADISKDAGKSKEEAGPKDGKADASTGDKKGAGPLSDTKKPKSPSASAGKRPRGNSISRDGSEAA